MPELGSDPITKAVAALALAAADLPCSNGCGCEDYDYCAQDECRAAIAELRPVQGYSVGL